MDEKIIFPDAKALEEWVFYLQQSNSADLAGKSTNSAPFHGTKPKIFKPEEVEQIKKMHQSGKSNREISRCWGCSEKTIRNYLKA